MDLTVSLHPITPEQMQAWYFEPFEDIGLIPKLPFRFPPEQLAKFSKEELEAFYHEKYRTILQRSRELDYDNFNRWHGYFIAVMQGFFETFYFVHASALSRIVERNGAFGKAYTTSLKEIIDPSYIDDLYLSPTLQGPFSSGVYLSAQNVSDLLDDYQNDPQIKELLEEEFPNERIKVLLEALKYAKNNHQGLLEAAKVIDPGEEIFDEPQCYSNVFNCDIISGVIYSNELAKKYDAIYKGLGE